MTWLITLSLLLVYHVMHDVGFDTHGEMILRPIPTKECWRTGGSNPRPPSYQSDVHPTELPAYAKEAKPLMKFFVDSRLFFHVAFFVCCCFYVCFLQNVSIQRAVEHSILLDYKAKMHTTPTDEILIFHTFDMRTLSWLSSYIFLLFLLVPWEA